MGDFGTAGAGMSKLAKNTQGNVTNFYKGQVQGSPGWTGAAQSVWAGLTSGIPLPQAIVQGIANAFGLNNVWSDITHVLSDIQNWAGNTVAGLINPSRLPLIPVSHIGQSNPNLLTNGGFQSAISIATGGTWTWDGTVGHNSPGSAKAVANGSSQVLNSNLINVVAGQALNLAGFVQWSGVTAGTGNAFQLNVQPYANGSPSGSATTIAAVASPAASGAWQQLAGTFTVPTGIDQIVTQIMVAPSVTAGNVWFDDLSTSKTGLMSMSWMNGATSGNTLATDFGNLLNNLFGSPTTIATTIANAVVPGIQTLTDAIGNGLGLTGTNHSTTVVQNQAAQTAQTANAASASAAAANATLAQQQAAANANNASGGAFFNITPSGADGAALPTADWVSGGQLVIRGSNGYIGIPTANADGVGYYEISAHAYTTDNQSLAVVLGDQGGSTSAPLTVCFHSNSTHTAGAYLRIDNSSLTLGSYTRTSGTNTYTFTPFTGGSIPGNLYISSGNRIEVRNVGTTYNVLLNGVSQGTVTSSAVTFGSTARSAVIAMDRKTTSGGWFQGNVTYDAFRVAAVSISDYVQPTYVGSGAVMARTTTTQVVPASGKAVAPANFFNSLIANTADITVSLANGQYTVSIEGWYQCTINYALSGNNGSAPALFKNGLIYQQGNGSVYDATNGEASLTMGGAFIVYLKATDYVQAGVSYGGSGSIGGDGTGSASYFSISLLNRSLV